MIVIELPYPPSVNALYRSMNGRNVLSKTAREYYSNRNIWSVKAQHTGKRITDRIAVLIEFHPSSNRKIDIDNRGKAVLDMLMKAGVIEDDSQVDLLTISRQEVVKGGRCIVTIERIEEMAA